MNTNLAPQNTAADDLFVYGASEWKMARWGWLESVRRDASLGLAARIVAHCLALDFNNNRTMQCDPSHAELAKVLGKSEDTAKRAIRELVEAGWIARHPGLGRGNHAAYGFVIRAQIVPLKGGKNAPLKGGRDAPFSRSQKGANLPSKGGKNAPRYNIAKPWKNHNARAHAGETPIFTAAEEAEARQFVDWLQRGGDVTKLRAHERAGLPRLLACAVALDLVTEEQAAALGYAEKGDVQDV